MPGVPPGTAPQVAFVLVPCVVTDNEASSKYTALMNNPADCVVYMKKVTVVLQLMASTPSDAQVSNADVGVDQTICPEAGFVPPLGSIPL